MQADEVDYQIIGDDMQMVEIELDPDEGVRAEVGAMLFMEDGIDMQTTTGGGFWKGFKRMLTGDGFFISTFSNRGSGKSKVAFAAPYPGKIIPVDLRDFGGQFLCQKDGFLCSAAGVDIDIAFTKKLGAGLFGGEGFILQRLSGDGMAFIHAGGTIFKKVLASGERLRMDTGCLVGFAPTVQYDIEFIGGFKNALFGGEGLFMATVTGPGLVYVQTLPFSRLADRVVAAAGWQNKGEVRRGGGLLGTLLNGD